MEQELTYSQKHYRKNKQKHKEYTNAYYHKNKSKFVNKYKIKKGERTYIDDDCLLQDDFSVNLGKVKINIF